MLAKWAQDPAGIRPGSRSFRLELVPEPPWSSADPRFSAPEGPAAIDHRDGLVRVGHRSFVSEIDPRGRVGRLFRRSFDRGGLEITLRTALCCCLPLEGGLPLHAAGVVAEGRGVVFFGPSGAGKSTLSALSPYPVLSDELVAVVAARPFALAASGFWGSGDEGRCPDGAWPLAALVHLGRGPRLSLERLGRRQALARLVEVIMVPPAPPLWAPALSVLGDVLQDIPVYRLTWAPDHPPWAEIRERLLAQATGGTGRGDAPGRKGAR